MATKDKKLSAEERHQRAIDQIKIIAPPHRKSGQSGQVRVTFHYNASGELCLAQIEDDQRF